MLVGGGENANIEIYHKFQRIATQTNIEHYLDTDIYI
jgi:hypothetical protein